MVLVLGMGALGALLGFMIAWSASPVVATVMPLLFGLVGGASGLSLAKMDLSKPGSQLKLKTLGSSLLSCCAACLVALVVGVTTKGALLTSESEALTFQFGVDQLANPLSAIDRLLLRKRLVSIGATKSEIQKIMGGDHKTDFKAAADSIARPVSELLAAYDQLPTDEQKNVDGNLGLSRFAKLIGAARIYAIMKGRMDADPTTPMTEDGLRFLTFSLYQMDLTTIFPEDSALKHFNDHPALVAAITDLAGALRKNSAAPDPSVRSAKIDELLKITANAKPGADIPIIAYNVSSTVPF